MHSADDDATLRRVQYVAYIMFKRDNYHDNIMHGCGLLIVQHQPNHITNLEHTRITIAFLSVAVIVAEVCALAAPQGCERRCHWMLFTSSVESCALRVSFVVTAVHGPDQAIRTFVGYLWLGTRQYSSEVPFLAAGKRPRYKYIHMGCKFGL